MGQWKYRKPEPSNIQGVCVVCNEKKQRKRKRGYLPYCSKCEKKLYGDGVKKHRNRRLSLLRRPYRKHVKTSCEKCGFVPEHPCQLDVDHIDANHNNNSEDNLQTLCANCHRLKTFLERQEPPVAF